MRGIFGKWIEPGRRLRGINQGKNKLVSKFKHESESEHTERERERGINARAYRGLLAVAFFSLPSLSKLDMFQSKRGSLGDRPPLCHVYFFLELSELGGSLQYQTHDTVNRASVPSSP